MALDDLWEKVRTLKTEKKLLPEKIGLEELILTLHFLYALRAVDLRAC